MSVEPELNPPNSGVERVQTAATQVVADLPEPLKKVGAVSNYSASEVIEVLRSDGSGIRSDSAMLMLRTMVQGTEQRACNDQAVRRELEQKISSLQEGVTRLEVANARLTEQANAAESEKQGRTLFLTLGGVGLGVAAQIAVENPSPFSVFASIVFFAVLMCGLAYPIGAKK